MARILLADDDIELSEMLADVRAGVWTELTTATFSFDSTGRGDRLDRFMGIENGEFFLSHGGFIDGSTKFGEKFTRPATGERPVIQLPPLTWPDSALR